MPLSNDVATRPSAAEIFANAAQVGEDELKRSNAGLAFSGLAAGLGMGLTGLAAAAVLAVLGPQTSGAELIATFFYPVGFIVVIVGRAQLFTENTVFPVILVLDRRRHLRNTARLWAVVFGSNVVGALLFAALVVPTGAVGPGVVQALAGLGRAAAQGSWVHLFWGAVLGGWIIGLVAWIVSASRFTIAQVALIWLMTFVVGIAHLVHSIAGSAEILSAVVNGDVGVGRYFYWLSAATVGNALGGVGIVSLLNYAQVVGSGRDQERAEQSLDEVEDASDVRSPPMSRRRRRRRVA